MVVVQKIKTCLWFENEAEEAMNFYTSIFKGKILEVSRWGEDGPGVPGSVIAGTFEIGGQEFMALNGRRDQPFTEAASLFVSCEDQHEVDRLWSELTADGGEESQCGWLKDRFGVSWQIIPEALPRLLGAPDPARAQRATQAMLQMRKIDIATLERAAAGA
jgi:predicted 3-demethylubiquinone-9 3-methyltransferase (glyoxalase superfamily)